MSSDDERHDPTDAPRGRNRPPDAAVLGGIEDPVAARLRTALDELTLGAEPNGTRLTVLTDRRRSRWMLPAVAAAAVMLVVAVAVVGRDDGVTPAAPTPTGPPVTPAAAPSMMPWYGIEAGDSITSPPPLNVDTADYRPSQVWASPDYSRVLVAMSGRTPAAATEPDDWPVVRPLPDPPSGVAWAFNGDSPGATWHGVYWAPDDQTSVVLTGHGFSPDELAAVLPALDVVHDEGEPRVISALSSLVPVADATHGFYTSPFLDPENGMTDGYAPALYVATGGAARPLALWSPAALSITPMTTPFGDGFRILTDRATHVWWRVDDGPFWAGLQAPEAAIDGLLDRVTRVADVPAPAPGDPPGNFVQAEPTAPPATQPGPAMIGVSEPTMTAKPEPTAPPATQPGPAMTIAGLERTTTTAARTSMPITEWQPPIAVGESVMGSAAEALGERGIEAIVEEAVQASDIAHQLESLRSADRLGDVVIIQAGTNGTLTAADLDRMMAAVADVERVVVMTVHADRSWIAPNNEAIRALPDRYPDVVVLDWDQIAATCACLAADGIHVQDRAIYADAVAAAAGLA